MIVGVERKPESTRLEDDCELFWTIKKVSSLFGCLCTRSHFFYTFLFILRFTFTLPHHVICVPSRLLSSEVVLACVLSQTKKDDTMRHCVLSPLGSWVSRTRMRKWKIQSVDHSTMLDVLNNWWESFNFSEFFFSLFVFTAQALKLYHFVIAEWRTQTAVRRWRAARPASRNEIGNFQLFNFQFGDIERKSKMTVNWLLLHKQNTEYFGSSCHVQFINNSQLNLMQRWAISVKCASNAWWCQAGETREILQVCCRFRSHGDGFDSLADSQRELVKFWNCENLLPPIKRQCDMSKQRVIN